MLPYISQTDRSAFERVRDAILNRDDPERDDNPTDPGAPTPG
ncbi:hypothetical protein [Haloarcula nitratireducens]|nr:hypothetical protein [Halomicroarcula nitratireducens]